MNKLENNFQPEYFFFWGHTQKKEGIGDKSIVLSGEMYQDGKLFYLSANGVWLTDFVETKYISK